MKYELFTDSFLVEKLAAGEEGAFREIYLRYGKKLFVLAHQKVGHRETAEELVQNLFVRLWEKRAEATIEHLDRYLFSSLKYAVLNHVRARIQEAKYLSYAERNSPAGENRTEAAVGYHDLSEALEKSIARLPEKTREIFKRSRMENSSVKEIARDLNLPTRTVEYHITQSLKALRLHLRDFGTFTLVGVILFF